MSTDIEWEKWGAKDPYYGVLTHPKFRSAALTEEAKAEFFALGRLHVDHVLHLCRTYLDDGFAPSRVLDFGCGVGRLVVPFAQSGAQVVGVDISQSMLEETRRNCAAAGVGGVTLVRSDDALSLVEGDFDLVHTCIVIQHIENARGLLIFRELVRRIRPGGMGALHVTFAWDYHAANFGVPPPPLPPSQQPWWRGLRSKLGAWIRGTSPGGAAATQADPEMQMNFYNLSQLMFMVQQAGVDMVHSQLTDHGGALGIFMFFRKPA